SNSHWSFLIWVKFISNRVTVTLQPSWSQIFVGETITVRCEIQGGGRTEWTYEWKADKLDRRPTHNEHRITAATESDSGKYSCRGRNDYLLTEWNIILVSPVRPVAEGDSVTLGCKLRKDKLVSSVFFYLNDKVIHNNSRGELSISAVSKSDEGFYKCQFSGQESQQSWMSVTVAVSGTSVFPVLLIVGLVCGFILIVLLFLLFRYRRSKGGVFLFLIFVYLLLSL
uniref:Ig-like domain-containing protein n=1 Tax=Mastacembelus armatus TaxID=205130 RepID=A0A7N8YRI5_9TELE